MNYDPINSDYKEREATFEFQTIYYQSPTQDYGILWTGNKVLQPFPISGAILKIPTAFNNPSAYFKLIGRVQAFLSAPDVSTNEYSIQLKPLSLGYYPNLTNLIKINGAPYQKGILGNYDKLNLGKNITEIDISILDFAFSVDPSQLLTTVLPDAFDPIGIFYVGLFLSITIEASW